MLTRSAFKRARKGDDGREQENIFDVLPDEILLHFLSYFSQGQLAAVAKVRGQSRFACWRGKKALPHFALLLYFHSKRSSTPY